MTFAPPSPVVTNWALVRVQDGCTVLACPCRCAQSTTEAKVKILQKKSTLRCFCVP